MTYSMASLFKKTIRGKTYYYARECRRVDGKPKIVWQKYLGRADNIIAALTQPTTPRTTAPQREFGNLNRLDNPSPVLSDGGLPATPSLRSPRGSPLSPCSESTENDTRSRTRLGLPRPRTGAAM